MELESWSLLRPDFFSMSDSFARDNEALTTALITSLSDASTSGSPIQTRPVSKSQPVTRNQISHGKITKRKSRASKKSPTTYINADPSNFRQMVQQVTGVRVGIGSEAGRAFDPVELVRPDPVRGDFGFLPTLDTSAGLLDRARLVNGFGSAGPVEVGGGSGFGFENGFNFPTLESWGAL